MPIYRWNMVWIFCIAFVYFWLSAGNGAAFRCSTAVSDCFLPPAVPSTDTIDGVREVKAVVLYATDAPPVWWKDVWNPDSQFSVPRFYKDNSFGKYILTADVYARPGIQFIPIERLDDSLNFADYDNDGPNGIPASRDSCGDSACLADFWLGDDDGFVDAFFTCNPVLTVLALGEEMCGIILPMTSAWEAGPYKLVEVGRLRAPSAPENGVFLSPLTNGGTRWGCLTCTEN